MTDEKARPIIFQAVNHHGISCGEPPYLTSSDAKQYAGYFQNEYGEQALFTYDRQTKQATLWVGDNGWDHPITITDPLKPDVMLNQAELLWLQACWRAATFDEK